MTAVCNNDRDGRNRRPSLLWRRTRRRRTSGGTNISQVGPLVCFFLGTLFAFVAVVVVPVASLETLDKTTNNRNQQHEQADTTRQDPDKEDKKNSNSNNPILAFFARQESDDSVEDSIYDPLQGDLECDNNNENPEDPSSSCHVNWEMPKSTIETETVVTQIIDATCSYGGADPDSEAEQQQLQPSASEEVCQQTITEEEVVVDKHWGSDRAILRMRDQLRLTGSGAATTSSSTSTTSAPRLHRQSTKSNRRPPIFLMPGLASTRLVAWRFKSCAHMFHSDIKVQDYVWLNINLIMQMKTIDVTCMSECLQLGRNQSDTDDLSVGCKLRPDEGLDAISSLSPGGIGSQLLVGGTNTVYAWLIQWLADNLGYDVSTIVGLPYDWRLSPDKMEQRDGFLTLTRRRIEAAVQSSGNVPGIMVAHSMGNSIFRYFLQWLRRELQEEAYDRYIRKVERRAKAKAANAAAVNNTASSYKPVWINNVGESEEDILKVIQNGTQRHEKLWELGQIEGEANWYEWVENHVWTYVGLSAPLLGATNPLRAVLSGENMGLPVSDADARIMEVTFGSTHTVNPISSQSAFCDEWEIAERWDEEPANTGSSSSEHGNASRQHADSKLACLDDILTEIEVSSEEMQYKHDVWEKFPALKSLLRDRCDWDTNHPMIRVIHETCEEKENPPCARNSKVDLGPKDVETGELFRYMSEVWKEKDDPLGFKREQLRESFWDTGHNILNSTWERPLIKHVIMAYGVDVPTEVAYEYIKTNREGEAAPEFDGVPTLKTALWEVAGGHIYEKYLKPAKGKLSDFWKKQPTRGPSRQGKFHHSGDGSVPYLSLAFAHTWLLHAVRAQRYNNINDDGPAVNPLDTIEISHRPEGEMTWVSGPPPKRIKIPGEESKKVEESSDTGTTHPHGTKYKPAMVRYHNRGTSRTTGIEYTTSVIEAHAVEHKETTRNFDILAAVFTDVLRYMHDDLDILSDENSDP